MLELSAERQSMRLSLAICILLQGCSILHVFTGIPLRRSGRSRNRLFCAHGWWDTSIDHGVLEPLECCTFLDLGFLKFAKQLVLHSLELHALLLELRDLVRHFLSLHVYIMPGVCSLLLDEIVLLLKSLRFGFSYLLLAELSVIEVVLAHSIQVMFNLLLLSSHFLDGCQLLVSEVFVSEVDLLFLLRLSLLHGFLLCF